MQKTNKTNETSIFSRVKGAVSAACRAVSDFFYDLSVKLHNALKKGKKQKTQSFSAVRKKQLIFYFSIVALPLIQYFIFYIYVNFNSVLLAFKQYKVVDGLTRYEFIGVKNFTDFFQQFFSGTDFKNMALNSLIIYAFGLLFCMPLSLLFSYYIYKKFALSGFFRVMLFLPSIISSVVTVFMYKFMLDQALPKMVETLFGITIDAPMSNPDNLMGAVLLFKFLCAFGGGVIMYSNAMARIPVSVTEYAAIDGVTPFREFFSIVLPLIYPTLSTFLIVGVAAFFTDQAYCFEMFATNADISVQTFGYYLFAQTYKSENNYPFASAVGLVFTLIAVPLTYGVKAILDRLDPEVSF